MRIVLFCEQKYAINILTPIQEETLKSGGHDILWYVHSEYPWLSLKRPSEVDRQHTDLWLFAGSHFRSLQHCPLLSARRKNTNLPWLCCRKKDHWVIRRYFDTYFTQALFSPKVSVLWQKNTRISGSRNRLAAAGLDFSGYLHTFDEEKSPAVTATPTWKISTLCTDFFAFSHLASSFESGTR